MYTQQFTKLALALTLLTACERSPYPSNASLARPYEVVKVVQFRDCTAYEFTSFIGTYFWRDCAKGEMK